MSRRRRNRFAGLGMVSLALLLALCVMGVAYAKWSDTISIVGTANIGHVEVVLSPGEGSPSGISCSLHPDDPHALVVALDGAPPGTYTCAFTITNTGSIPVKIQSIVPLAYPEGVDVSVSGVAVGDQIEQAGVYPDSVGGEVIVTVPEGVEGTFSFSLAFSFIQWNLYV